MLLTPVRRSARKTDLTQIPTTENLLNEARFNYAPNLALQQSGLKPMVPKSAMKTASSRHRSTPVKFNLDAVEDESPAPKQSNLRENISPQLAPSVLTKVGMEDAACRPAAPGTPQSPRGAFTPFKQAGFDGTMD